MESWSNQTGSLRFQDVCERLRMKLNTVAYLEGQTNQSIWWALGLEIHLACKDIWLQVAKIYQGTSQTNLGMGSIQ